MKKRTKTVLILAAGCFVIVLFAWKGGEKKIDIPGTGQSVQTERKMEEIPEEPVKPVPETKKETKKEQEKSKENHKENDQEKIQNGGAGEIPADETESGEEEAAEEVLKESAFFPYTASEDGLLIRTVYNYIGRFVEDGSGTEVSGVAAAEIENRSDQMIEYAEVKLKNNGEELNFRISLLPAGATVIVMEADKKECDPKGAYEYAGSGIAYLPSPDMLEEKVKVSPVEKGGIAVENISGESIAQLRIFYKNRMKSGEYMGGIAYTVKLEHLDAGETKTVYPLHFDAEGGNVMMVREY